MYTVSSHNVLHLPLSDFVIVPKYNISSLKYKIWQGPAEAGNPDPISVSTFLTRFFVPKDWRKIQHCQLGLSLPFSLGFSDAANDYWLISCRDTHCLSTGTLRRILTALGSFKYRSYPVSSSSTSEAKLSGWLFILASTHLLGKKARHCKFCFLFHSLSSFPLLLQGSICQRLIHSPVTQHFVLIKDKVFKQIASGMHRIGLTHSRRNGTLCVFNTGTHPRSLIH